MLSEAISVGSTRFRYGVHQNTNPPMLLIPAHEAERRVGFGMSYERRLRGADAGGQYGVPMIYMIDWGSSRFNWGFRRNFAIRVGGGRLLILRWGWIERVDLGSIRYDNATILGVACGFLFYAEGYEPFKATIGRDLARSIRRARRRDSSCGGWGE